MAAKFEPFVRRTRTKLRPKQLVSKFRSRNYQKKIHLRNVYGSAVVLIDTSRLKYGSGVAVVDTSCLLYDVGSAFIDIDGLIKGNGNVLRHIPVSILTFSPIKNEFVTSYKSYIFPAHYIKPFENV